MLFRFAQPQLLAVLLAIAPVLWWHLHTRRNGLALLGFPTVAIARRIRRTARQAARPLLYGLRLAALVLLALSLARPIISRAAENSPSAGIDIALAIDVSYSMTTSDMGPKNRIDTAKDVVRQFIAGRSGDRVGLVAFASEAVPVSPLTSDYPTLLGLVDEVRLGRLPDGTAIGNGLATAVNLLRDGTGKSRVIILLTDGENNTGDITPEAAAHMAQLLNIKVYTIGVGGGSNTAGRTGRGSANFRSYNSGVDEATLRSISETTGAAYFRAADQTALKQIYDIIGEMEKTDTGPVQYVDIVDLSGYLLLAAIGIVLVEVVLQTTWLRAVP